MKSFFDIACLSLRLQADVHVLQKRTPNPLVWQFSRFACRLGLVCLHGDGPRKWLIG